MNIPLDRLYHYIQQISEEIFGGRVLIYRFWPHGSKNISNLVQLSPHVWNEIMTFPIVYCHDQEPLHYDLYQDKSAFNNGPFTKLLKSLDLYKQPPNLILFNNIFKKSLLIHSEQRSTELQKYSDINMIPVYYWSHAVIARDWFRYSQHVTLNKNIQKPFLIYNRAWSGTREYRLKFLELLIKAGLETHCHTSINPIEPELGIHYEIHNFKNPAWRPDVPLEDFFAVGNAHSHYSADFDIEDYKATDIEVVLETLFDDSRLHLTEKSLRPIACGQPFIIAGTQGSLEYLRSYGFKTFMHLWDERYDLIEDPKERMIAITGLMRQIANWDDNTRANIMAQARIIAEYNRQHFFSKEFFNLVVDELKTNLQSAFDEFNLCNNYKEWTDHWSHLMTHPEVVEYLETNQDPIFPTSSQLDFVMQLVQNKL